MPCTKFDKLRKGRLCLQGGSQDLLVLLRYACDPRPGGDLLLLLPTQGGRECLSGLPLPTREQVTRTWGLLVCALLWLPGRMLHVFLGTYMSRNEDVRKAGLAADSNALALAVAVILLLTSRATFNKAEETINVQAWANLVLDDPAQVCASLNQKPFLGKIFHNFYFYCQVQIDVPGHPPVPAGRTSLALNASNQMQVLSLLRGMHEDCGAFAMAIDYRPASKSTVMEYVSESNITRKLDFEATLHRSAEENGIYRWRSFDWISPADRSACKNNFDVDRLQLALKNGTYFDPVNASRDIAEFPSDLGFPQGMAVVRWLDEYNRGMFLGVKCHGSIWSTPEELSQCISLSGRVHNASGLWDAHGRPDAPLKGPQDAAFCGSMDNMTFKTFPHPYRCSNGAQSSSVQILEDERNALKAVLKFAYFRCVTYDELYAVYVGIIGVLIAAALTTTTLVFTDVLRPMLLAGRQAWSWDTVGPSVAGVASEDSKRRHVREANMIDVVLRCAASCAVGTLLGMSFLYVPYVVFIESQGQSDGRCMSEIA